MLYALIGCVILIAFLGYKLSQKIKIDQEELANYKSELGLYCHATEMQRQVLTNLQNDCRIEQERYEEAVKKNNEQIDERIYQIDNIIAEQRQKRQEELNKSLEETKEKHQLILQALERDCWNKAEVYEQELNDKKATTEATIANLNKLVADARARYDGLIESIKRYEKEKQEKLFYTIQLPEEYQEDIDYLLTVVSPKVQHPDIISKLVWAEYVKPNLDNTFKRIEIQSAPGIYKLTSLQTGMAYIGKSTDVKKRIADHFKSSVGIKSIADQAVHHAILKEGFWNWTIEVVTYAEKERLNELEKYYIEFFKTQEYGYNKNSGGGG